MNVGQNEKLGNNKMEEDELTHHRHDNEWNRNAAGVIVSMANWDLYTQKEVHLIRLIKSMVPHGRFGQLPHAVKARAK